MKPLTVCMFTNLFPPIVSGSSTHTAALSRELTKRGHRVIVITVKTAECTGDHEERDGFDVFRLPAVRLPRMQISFYFPWLSLTFTPANLRRIRRIVSTYQPDVLHAHNHMFDLSFSAVAMQRLTRKPLVVTIHTIVKHSVSRYNILLYPFDRIVLRYTVIRSAQTVISPDKNAQSYVEEAFGRDDSVIIPYGVELPAARPGDREELVARYGLDGRRVILSMGHVNDNRNRRDIIEAMPYILERVPEAVLLIVGGIDTQEPVEHVRRLGLQDAVIFTGRVPHYLVPAFLELDDIEVHWLNQDDTELTSLGIASMEAMAAGKAVLSAANEATYGPGILRNGENFLVVERDSPERLARTITALMNDRSRCREIGARARETIREHFSWDSVCARTVDVYREAIRKRARRQILPNGTAQPPPPSPED